MCTSSSTWQDFLTSSRQISALVGSDDADVFGASCWKSFCLPPLVRLFIIFSSCWIFPDITVKCVRMKNRHLLTSSTPGFHGHIPWFRSTRTLVLSLTRSVSAILSFHVFILAFPSKFSEWPFWFFLDIHRHVALSLFCAMQVLRILGSLLCVREFTCPQTRRRLFWVQTSGALSTTILGNGSPAPLSAVTFCVNFNSGVTFYHGVPQTSQFVDSQASLSVCLVQL